MGLFGFGKSAVEKRLIQEFSTGLRASGCTAAEAKEMANDFLEVARQMVEEQGKEINYESYMRLAETEDSEKRQLAAKREDGVTDADLRWWWGMPDIERFMTVVSETNTRVSFLSSKSQEGLSGDDAWAALREALPIYGDPTDTTNTTGDDRPLPDELKDRASRWLWPKMADRDGFRKRLAEFSTYNALIRHEVRSGNL